MKEPQVSFQFPFIKASKYLNTNVLAQIFEHVPNICVTGKSTGKIFLVCLLKLKFNPYLFRVKDIAPIVRGCVQRFWTQDAGIGEWLLEFFCTNRGSKNSFVLGAAGGS